MQICAVFPAHFPLISRSFPAAVPMASRFGLGGIVAVVSLMSCKCRGCGAPALGAGSDGCN
jgi:hypothetical protein